MAQTKTEKEILDATRDAMARKVVTYWDHLKFVMADTTPPVTLTDAPPIAGDLMMMSDDAIKLRKVRLRVIKDGKEVDEYFELKDIDARLEEFKKKHASEPQVAAAMDAMGGTISSMVPSIDTIKTTAGAIDKGVSEAGGTASKMWNFISGAIQWLTSAVQALFSGKPIPRFWETVAKGAAPNAQGNVQNHLDAAAAKDPEVARFLHQRDDYGKTVMDSIQSKVHDGTYKALGIAAPPSDTSATVAPPLEKLKPLGTGVTADYFKEGVKQKILEQKNAAGLPALEETIKAGLTSEVADYVKSKWTLDPRRAMAPGAPAIAAAAHKMADTIADSVGATLSDPKNREELSKLKDKPEALSQFIAKKVADEVAKNQATYGIPLDFTSDTGKKKREKFEVQIAGELTKPEKHEMLAKAISLSNLIKTPELTASAGKPPADLLAGDFSVAGVSHDAKAHLPSNGEFVGSAQVSPRGAALNPATRMGA